MPDLWNGKRNDRKQHSSENGPTEDSEESSDKHSSVSIGDLFVDFVHLWFLINEGGGNVRVDFAIKHHYETIISTDLPIIWGSFYTMLSRKTGTPLFFDRFDVIPIRKFRSLL